MIYFLRCKHTLYADSETIWLPANAIKIGATKHLTLRLKQITRDFGYQPPLLAVLDGSFPEERLLHSRFKSTRIRGDWFKPSRSLLHFIRTEGLPWDGTDEFGTVEIHDDVLRKARTVAKYLKVPLTDFLSGILCEPVETALQKMATEIVRE